MRQEKLIFVISLPRSGSTMLQHIIGAHSKVAASAEPWILFPGAVALREDGIHGMYDHGIGRVALIDFLNQLKGKDQVYYDAIRAMSLHLYGTFSEEKGKDFFVDKTSRYYLIIPELLKIFPNAKFVLLIRNPIATFASFVTSMVKNNLLNLGRHNYVKRDLMSGFKLVNEALQNQKDNFHIVHYEKLVTNTNEEVEKICNHIGLDFEEEMIDYQSRIGVLPGKLVDPKSIHKHGTAVDDYLEAWKKSLKTNQDKTIAKGFMEHLGKDLVSKLGYSYDETVNYLDANCLPEQSLHGYQWSDIMTSEEEKSPEQLLRFELMNALEAKSLTWLIRIFMRKPGLTAKLLKSHFSAVGFQIFKK